MMVVGGGYWRGWSSERLEMTGNIRFEIWEFYKSRLLSRVQGALNDKIGLGGWTGELVRIGAECL